MPGYQDRPQQPLLRQFGGLNTVTSEIGLPDSDSPAMVNIDLHPQGSIKKRMGVSAFSTPESVTKLNAIMRLNQPENSRAWLYTISDTAIHRSLDDGSPSWELPVKSSGVYTFPAQDEYGRAIAHYVESGGTAHKSVLYLPRVGQVPLLALGQASRVGDLIEMPAGAAFSPGPGAMGYPPEWTGTHWPKYCRLIGIGRGARMYYWGFPDDGNIIYYSDMNVPWNLMNTAVLTAATVADTDGGSFYASEGDGDEVVTVIDMFSYIVVGKRRKTLIYTGDPGYSDWNLAAEFPVGFVSDSCWVKVGNDILFWSDDGPRSLSAVQEYGDLANTHLALKIADTVTNIVPNTYNRIRCYHDVPNMRVVWFVPESGSSHNDKAYVYYYTSGRWSVWTGARTEMMDVLLVKTSTYEAARVIGASYDNGLVLHDSGYYDVADEIDCYYVTNWINVGSLSDAARSLWLDLFYGDGGSNCAIEYQADLDGEWKPITRVLRSLGSSGTTWGNFAWSEAQWAVTGRSHKRMEFDKLNHLVRFRFSGVDARKFEVMAYSIENRMKGAGT